MSRKELMWELIYYLAVLVVWYVTIYDGPPVKVTFYYHLYRTSQAVARKAGSIGLAAEHSYHVELERTKL